MLGVAASGFVDDLQRNEATTRGTAMGNAAFYQLKYNTTLSGFKIRVNFLAIIISSLRDSFFLPKCKEELNPGDK